MRVELGQRDPERFGHGRKLGGGARRGKEGQRDDCIACGAGIVWRWRCRWAA
jgi:hypothetical protein